MIWGLPKIHHAAMPMASGFLGRSLPWLRANNDLIAQTKVGSTELTGAINHYAFPLLQFHRKVTHR